MVEDFIPGKLYRLNNDEQIDGTDPTLWYTKRQTVLVLDIEHMDNGARVVTFLTDDGIIHRLPYSYGCLFQRRAVLLP